MHTSLLDDCILAQTSVREPQVIALLLLFFQIHGTEKPHLALCLQPAAKKNNNF